MWLCERAPWLPDQAVLDAPVQSIERVGDLFGRSGRLRKRVRVHSSLMWADQRARKRSVAREAEQDVA